MTYIALIYWFLMAPHYWNKINQRHLNHRLLAYFRVLSLPEKKSTTILFFEGKPNFFPSPRHYSQVLKKVFRGSLSNSYLQWTNLTNRPKNHTQFYIFGNFPAIRKWQNSSSGRDKTKMFIDKVPFTLHPCVGLMHNSITAKEQKKIAQSMPLKKTSKLVLSLPEQKSLKKR